PESVKAALSGVDKLFLLVGNVADELTQALLTNAVAREAKIKHVTYLSVFGAERFPGVPHFIGKQTVENAIKSFDTPFSILRPGYFFQNDARFKDLLTGPGVFPLPIGTVGVGAVDVRDIADAAAITLTTDGHAGKTYNLVSHSILTGLGAAEVWSKALGKPVIYPGMPLEDFERQLRQMVPAWLAMDMRLMFQIYQEQGNVPAAGDADALSKLLGHAPRRYEDFVRQTVAAWRA
ncbi:MAG TPA: NmrA family NAD(P)-binding protein, partial [Tepidisphaeraceae bacterium]|nr:NmrA family NAD(P)-binding protein [Tepidisphaeraceae bacterium]